MKPPIIGITLDSEPSGGYAAHPWYAIRENYCDAVSSAGGIPVLLPHEADRADDYLAMVSGLIITGGAFDVDPAMFGAKMRHGSVKTKDRRTKFEFAVTKGAITLDMPVLGICGGEQLINVVFGGTLIQHIPDEIEDAIEHEQPNPRSEPGHIVDLTPNTLLSRIAGKTKFSVNSSHHQAVREPGDGLIINAFAPDGVIEGIESPKNRFCLGVQWHPEFGIDDADGKMFKALIDASS